MVYENILQAMGNTPLVKISGFNEEGRAEIYAKCENLNVGGSIKTRTAYNMILKAKEKGLINQNSVIVEPSSGNQGVGLALVGAVLSLKVVIIMPSSVSNERRKLIKQYGAKVIIVKDNGDIGECIKKCIQLAVDMKKRDPRVFIPNQFANENNPLAHYETTAKEIIESLPNINAFCAGVGSGGTVSGVGRALKELNENIQVWAIEPTNSAVLAGKSSGAHIQMGIGDGIIPPVLNRKILSGVLTVSDKTALYYAKALAKTQGLLCGITSGSNLAGAIHLAKKLGKGKRVVTVLPDTGERYFSTQLFD